MTDKFTQPAPLDVAQMRADADRTNDHNKLSAYVHALADAYEALQRNSRVNCFRSGRCEDGEPPCQACTETSISTKELSRELASAYARGQADEREAVNKAWIKELRRQYRLADHIGDMLTPEDTAERIRARGGKT